MGSDQAEALNRYNRYSLEKLMLLSLMAAINEDALLVTNKL